MLTYNEFHTEFVGMVMTYLHNRFHIPSNNVYLVIGTKPTAITLSYKKVSGENEHACGRPMSCGLRGHIQKFPD
jgi:hypothetical protein